MATKDWKKTNENEWTNSKIKEVIQIATIYDKTLVNVLDISTSHIKNQFVLSKEDLAIGKVNDYMRYH